MHISLNFLLLGISLLLLVKASDKLVDNATILANKIGISHFLIGLSVVSVGTSLPELGVAVAASVAKDSEIVLGNILGANIINIALLLGVALLITSIKIKKYEFKTDAPLLLIITSIFIILGIDGEYNYIDGVLFLLLFVFYMLFLFQREDLVVEAAKKIKIEGEEKKHPHLVIYRVFVILVLSLIIYFAARITVFSGENIALFFGVSKVVVSLIAISLGTTLPELGVTLAAARKNDTEMLLGNIIGSNISNILLVGGIASIIYTLDVHAKVLFFVYPILGFVTLLLLVFMRMKQEFRYKEGMSFLMIYLFFVVVSVYLGVS